MTAANANGLARPAVFYNDLRRTKALGPTLSTAEVDGCEAILMACHDWPLSWTSYALATACHETARTMQPIREYGSDAYLDKYDTGRLAKALGNTPEDDDDGILYCGRGFVQITGLRNYRLAGKELGLPLVTHPELALRPDVAAKILRQGMSKGWFTGRKLGDYLPTPGVASRTQYEDARRVINGQDRAEDIAALALIFETAILAAGWRVAA